MANAANGGAFYCATKHAVRALTEGLRQEVLPCLVSAPGSDGLAPHSPPAVFFRRPRGLTANLSAKVLRAILSTAAPPGLMMAGLHSPPVPADSQKQWQNPAEH